MAKVRVVGDVNFEFDVKYNQTEDIIIEAKLVDINDMGEKIYVASGNVEKINPKVFSFISSRITQSLKKHGAITEVPLGLRNKDNTTQKLIEKGYGFLVDARYGSNDAVNEMLEKKMFILTEDGIRFYLKKFYERNK